MNPFKTLWNWLWKATPAPTAALAGSNVGFGFIDAYHKHRAPTARELLEELKNTAWCCAHINASACAANEPDLYVMTSERKHPSPKCLTSPLPTRKMQEIRDRRRLTKDYRIDQVDDHPLLTLLANPNPIHNAWDLWELAAIYQETVGSAYWLLVTNMFGVPCQIWPIASQIIRQVRKQGSPNIVDYYSLRGSASEEVRYQPNEIIHMKFPDPKDPYGPGLSPLRAACEQVKLSSQYAAYRLAMFDNNALPNAVISPDEVMGEEERHRLEELWNQKFRRGGAGKVIVAESAMTVSLLQHSLADLGALAEYGSTRQDIANAFGVPIAYLTAESNLANLQAAQTQHMSLTISPRLTRRDEKLNQELVTRFDKSGRLFLESEDPVPGNRDANLNQDKVDLTYGVKSINEVRGERGLGPVPWGETPWLPTHWAPSDDHVARQVRVPTPPPLSQDETTNSQINDAVN